jgi:uncharacterized membrane protein HdeD (DUF308 family)
MNGSSFLLIRGIVGVAIGALAILWPGITLAVLVGIFGFYAILDGITNLMLGLSRREPHTGSWAQAVQGAFGVCAGVLALLWPGVTALVLVLFIGAWAIVTGVLEIIAAVRLRRVIAGEWLLALSGCMSVLFGILVFAFPGAGAVSIAWILGVYTVAAGMVLIMLGLRLRTFVAAP